MHKSKKKEKKEKKRNPKREKKTHWPPSSLLGRSLLPGPSLIPVLGSGAPGCPRVLIGPRPAVVRSAARAGADRYVSGPAPETEGPAPGFWALRIGVQEGTTVPAAPEGCCLRSCLLRLDACVPHGPPRRSHLRAPFRRPSLRGRVS